MTEPVVDTKRAAPASSADTEHMRRNHVAPQGNYPIPISHGFFLAVPVCATDRLEALSASGAATSIKKPRCLAPRPAQNCGVILIPVSSLSFSEPPSPHGSATSPDRSYRELQNTDHFPSSRGNSRDVHAGSVVPDCGLGSTVSSPCQARAFPARRSGARRVWGSRRRTNPLKNGRCARWQDR
jgi:hypothetical protein